MQWEYLFLAVMSAGIVLLFLFGIRIVKRSANKRIAQFKILCTSNGIHPDLYEFFSNRAIGVDYKAGKILFVHFNGDSFHHSILNVSEVESCDIEKQDNENRITHAIWLNCGMRNRTTIRMNFYNAVADNHFDSTHIIRKASYWRKKINQLKQLDELSLQQFRN